MRCNTSVVPPCRIGFNSYAASRLKKTRVPVDMVSLTNSNALWLVKPQMRIKLRSIQGGVCR